MKIPFISFIILNYNGKEITERCIFSLKEAIKNSIIKNYEIIVIDNGSEDGSEDYLKNKFNDIYILQIGTNKYINAYNDGVKLSKGAWVFLFNNDMTFDINFINPIINYLDKNDIFAVGCKMVSPEGVFEKGRNYITYKYGYIWLKTEDTQNASPTFYIGTHGIFNKEKFLKLNGFDNIYSPFYVEDLDICYRALKRGWKIYYEPNSIIYHKHMTTINKFFNKKYVLKIYARNHLIFHFKNLTSSKLFLNYILNLPILLIGSLFIKKSYYFFAFFDVLKKLKEVLNKRKLELKEEVIKDEEILREYKFNQF